MNVACLPASFVVTFSKEKGNNSNIHNNTKDKERAQDEKHIMKRQSESICFCCCVGGVCVYAYRIPVVIITTTTIIITTTTTNNQQQQQQQ